MASLRAAQLRGLMQQVGVSGVGFDAAELEAVASSASGSSPDTGSHRSYDRHMAPAVGVQRAMCGSGADVPRARHVACCGGCQVARVRCRASLHVREQAPGFGGSADTPSESPEDGGGGESLSTSTLSLPGYVLDELTHAAGTRTCV